MAIKHFTTLFLLIALQWSTFSQITPSVYTGIGTGTYLGGVVGMGTEIRYKMLSINAAIGSWTAKFPSHKGIQSRFDYDFGLKYYIKYGLFAGVNYGIIDEVMYMEPVQGVWHFEKTHGYSFTIGYRRNINKNIFGMLYTGLTSNKDKNRLAFDNSLTPRIGLIIGYEFKKEDKITE